MARTKQTAQKAVPSFMNGSNTKVASKPNGNGKGSSAGTIIVSKFDKEDYRPVHPKRYRPGAAARRDIRAYEKRKTVNSNYFCLYHF